MSWAAVGASCVCALCSGCGSKPLPPPGQIVFVANPTTPGYQIYVMDADGGDTHAVPRVFDGAWGTTWSPDGTRIAFEGGSSICVVDLEGLSERCLTPAAERSEGPAWSPDGKQIAFARWQSDPGNDGATDVYVVDVDSRAERQITNAGGEDGDPSWSPDGKRIVLSSLRSGSNDYDLFVVNADGSGTRRLTRTAGLDFFPDWSPDGKQILFERRGETKGGDPRHPDYGDIWVVNADGSEPRNLGTSRSEGHPVWSPDGKQIVFICNVPDTGSDEICVMAANGSGRRVLTSFDGGVDGTAQPDWAPKRGDD